MNDGTQDDPAAPGGRDEHGDAGPSQLAALRRALAQSVVVTGERVQEAVEDAVRRGRMTRRDAQELASALLAASRRQTEDIRQELEALLDRGRGRRARREPEGAAVSIPIERDERAPSSVAPPIEGYDDLTAVLVRKRLPGLSAAELRAVRDHEAAHANRKTVLEAVDRRLAAG